MRKSALYSSSGPAPRASGAQDLPPGVPSPGRASRLATLRKISPNDPRLLWSAIGLLTVLLLISISLTLRPAGPKLTQEIIDSAVLKTLETAELPSPAAKAYETILPSVVRVMGYIKSKDGKEDMQNGVGTGVVIVDKGIILTNLHVVQGAQSIKVIFSDGLESTASVTGVQPENDLAVLQAPHHTRRHDCRHHALDGRFAPRRPGAGSGVSVWHWTVCLSRRGVRPEALVSFARGQAGDEKPDPV